MAGRCKVMDQSHYSHQVEFGKSSSEAMQGNEQDLVAPVVVKSVTRVTMPVTLPLPSQEDTIALPLMESDPTSDKESLVLRVSGFIPPEQGRKPAYVWFGESHWSVSSWRELIEVLVRHFHQSNPLRYEAIFEASEFRGRKRRYFSRSLDGMVSPVVIPGGFFEGNLGAVSIVQIAQRLISFFGENPTQGGYSYRLDRSSDSSDS